MRKYIRYLLLFTIWGGLVYSDVIVDRHVHVTVEQIKQEVADAKRARFQSEVRTGPSISPREFQTICRRLEKVYRGAQDFTGQSFEIGETPVVSLVCSGGGYRAMISTAGFLSGLEEIGLLDASTYLAGLSGSTWTMASWLSQDLSLEELRVFLRKQTSKHIKDYPISFSGLAVSLARKFYYGQPITLADIWGYLVGRVIFGKIDNGAFDARLSHLADKVEDGDTVFPLFTAVLSDTSPYEWMEFSPYEVGSEFLNAWVTPECFGKNFSGGITTDTAPEQSFSYLTGIFGSAYAASVWDILMRLKEKIDDWGKNKDYKSFFVSDILNLLDFRLSPARVRSFTRRMQGCNFSGYKYYELVDGGMDFNLPFSAVLRRMPDIIIVCDVSADSVDAKKSRALQHAQCYAKRKGFKFPEIPIKNLGVNTVDIFYDEEDPECPIIVYFPNQVDFSTLKMQYSNDEFDSLFGYMRDAVVKSKNKLVNVLNRGVRNMRRRMP